MGYRITIDRSDCINCGVCMDVCPVQALDMTRPPRGGPETGGSGSPLAWMMEYPVQVGECVGCGICTHECPVQVMTLDSVPGPTPLLARQGPLQAPSEDGGWAPLSSVTLDSLKHDHPEPFDGLWGWRASERPEPWQTWRSMVTSRHDPQAPCQTACPAGTDAGRYVGLVAQGRYDEAYAVAAEVNPFPSVCGWICTAPCEAACRRGTLDEPIAIRTLKRFAVEHGKLPAVPPPVTRRRERVAIVGGGPAGMSAAYYLARLGYPVTVFEAMPVPGGMMAIGIPEYRLPREALKAEIDRILALGVELRLDSAMGRDYSLGDLESQGFRAIFLATGASRSRRLGVPGDGLAGVVPATLFLKQVNLGEAPRLSGAVVVVGGGSTAMDASRSAIRSGASSVTVLYRRARADMPAQPEEIEAAEREGVVIRDVCAVVEVLGDRGVHGVRVQRQQATGERSGGRVLYASVDGSDEELPVSCILVAVGEEPDPSILPEGAGIEVSAFAGIAADRRTLATGRAGVFAGGDVVSGPKTIIDAVAAGRRAAASVHEYLAGSVNGDADIMAVVRYGTPPDRQLNLDIASRAREHPPLPIFQPGSFRATQTGLEEVAARSEASRCFRCDALPRCSSVEVVAGRGPRPQHTVPRSAPPTMPVAAPSPATTPTPRRSSIMTPDQVSGFFDAGETFVEGTIAALLVAFWIIVVAVQLARPYMLRNLQKFTLRLGADLWWIVYVGLREILIISLFLGGFIFLYPDVVAGNPLPITGGLATVCAFLVLYLKLVSKGESDARAYRIETLLLGLGATLYLVPYVLGVQVMTVDGMQGLANIFVSDLNTDVALPLCYLSGALIGLIGLMAVVYNFRAASTGKPRAMKPEETLS